MCSDVWLIRIISSLMMFSVTPQCLLILIVLSHLNFSHPYLPRKVDGKVMTPLQQGITLLHMKRLRH